MADSTTPAGSDVADRAITIFKAGNMEEAAPLLRQAIEFEPDRFDLRMYLGFALAKNDKWQDAERQFARAEEIDGSSAEASYFLGVAIAKQGRLREAHGQFMVALANDPNHEKAKSAEAKTRKAAEQVTTDGSSAAAPGGLDFGNLALEGMMAGKGIKSGSAPSAPSADVSSALQDFKQQESGKKAKKAGCIGSLVALATVAALLVALVGLLTG